MIESPKNVNLPDSSTWVENVDEEIFECYTNKNRFENSTSTSNLGLLGMNKSSVNIQFTLTDPTIPPSKNKGTGKQRQVEVDISISQDLNGLHNRAGDTSSVVWRSTILLAKFLLQQHYFPPSTPLFPSLSSSTVLELGSGTGALGIILESKQVVGKWIFSDLLPSLDLVLKNTISNENQSPDIRELDWNDPVLNEEIDFIFAVDCLYNPSLAGLLARTIDKCASRDTILVVMAELREEEALEVFLTEILSLKWRLYRVEGVEGAEKSGQFVMWVGWKDSNTLK